MNPFDIFQFQSIPHAHVHIVHVLWQLASLINQGMKAKAMKARIPEDPRGSHHCTSRQYSLHWVLIACHTGGQLGGQRGGRYQHGVSMVAEGLWSWSLPHSSPFHLFVSIPLWHSGTSLPRWCPHSGTWPFQNWRFRLEPMDHQWSSLIITDEWIIIWIINMLIKCGWSLPLHSTAVGRNHHTEALSFRVRSCPEATVYRRHYSSLCFVAVKWVALFSSQSFPLNNCEEKES